MSAIDSGMINTDYQEWKKKRQKEQLNYLLLCGCGILIFFGLWQAAVSLGIADAKLLPAPLQVFETIVQKIYQKEPDGNVLLVNILASLQVALSGFLLAMIIGIPLGGVFSPNL